MNGRSNGKPGYILGYFILECFSSCFGEAQTGIYYQISQGQNHNQRVSLPKLQSSQDFFPTCQDLPIEDSHIYSNTSLSLQSSNALDVSSSLRTSNDSNSNAMSIIEVTNFKAEIAQNQADIQNLKPNSAHLRMKMKKNS